MGKCKFWNTRTKDKNLFCLVVLSILCLSLVRNNNLGNKKKPRRKNCLVSTTARSQVPTRTKRRSDGGVSVCIRCRGDENRVREGRHQTHLHPLHLEAFASRSKQPIQPESGIRIRMGASRAFAAVGGLLLAPVKVQASYFLRPFRRRFLRSGHHQTPYQASGALLFLHPLSFSFGKSSICTLNLAEWINLNVNFINQNTQS